MKNPSPADLPRIEEQLHRFRSAMLLCFAAALGIYALVVSTRSEKLASLGLAFWVVGVLLTFFVVYFRAQRRLAARE